MFKEDYDVIRVIVKIERRLVDFSIVQMKYYRYLNPTVMLMKIRRKISINSA